MQNQSMVSVRLNSVGPNRLQVSNFIREVSGIEQEAVNNIVDNVPSWVLENVDYDKARLVVVALSGFGADTTIIENTSVVSQESKTKSNSTVEKVVTDDMTKEEIYYNSADHDNGVFCIFDDRLIVFDDKIKVIKSRMLAKSLAISASQEFRAQYKKMENIDTLVRRGYDIASNILLDKAEQCAEFLVGYGIYSYSGEALIGLISDSYFDNEFEKIQDWYIETINDQTEKENYRRMRKQYRNKWVGYGIGTQAAMSARIQASTLNAMSGMAHGMANAVGNTFTAIGTVMSKSAKYNDDNTVNSLCRALYLDVYYLNYALQVILLGDVGELDFIGLDEEKQAETIFDNLKKYVSSNGIDDEAKKMAYELFYTNPTEYEYYEYCLKQFPKDGFELIALADFVGFNMNDEREQILLNFLDCSDYSTEEKAIEVRKQIEKKEKQLGMEGSAALSKIEQIITNYDIAARTFKDILFDTREERQKAEIDYSSLVQDYPFEVIESASEQSCNAMKQEIASVAALEQIKKIFINKINERINNIWASEDESELKRIFMNTRVENPSEINKAVQLIQSVGRTKDMDRYIEALNKFTADNIKTIRKGLKAENQNIVLKIIENIIGIIMIFFGVCCLSVGELLLTIIFIIVGLVILLNRLAKIGQKNILWKELTLNDTLVHPYLLYIRSEYDNKNKR